MAHINHPLLRKFHMFHRGTAPAFRGAFTVGYDETKWQSLHIMGNNHEKIA